MKTGFRVSAALACAGLFCAMAQEPGKFEMIGTYKGLGGMVASLVGPGAAPGSEWFYASYLYADNTLEVVGIGYHVTARRDATGRNVDMRMALVIVSNDHIRSILREAHAVHEVAGNAAILLIGKRRIIWRR